MNYNFSISPRILAHLGEDLIKNESIALFELIKNSYDACASNCIIDFSFKDGKLNTITIEDDGFGMSKKIIESVWLVVGTDNKKKNLRINECGRIPLGEKGIGRLGIHKLGHKISLISKSIDQPEVEVLIDWQQLDKVKKITDFIVEIEENNKSKYFLKDTGTKIIIENLKSSWDKTQLREVYRNINSLNSPFSDTNDAFKVLATSNTNIFEGLPDFEDIKDNALYFANCKMSGNLITEFTYEFKPWESLKKVDAGRIITLSDISKEDQIIKKYNSETKEFDEINLNDRGIGPIEFDIIIFDMDSQILNFVNTEKTSLRTYLKENGGIRVYRDGVRVYNYGERDNDWLGIDLKRVKRVGGNVSNNIIIGAVKLNRADSYGLVEKTNREGFIEDESYSDFNEAVNYALSIVVRERNNDKSLLTTLYKKHKALEPVLSDLSELVEIVQDKVEPNETKEEILTYLHRINDQYKDVKEVLIKSANAGLNLSVVIHEIDKLISQLSGCIERNEKDKAVRISLMLEKIIRGYSAMIKKSSIKLTNLSEAVRVALDNYEFRFSDHQVNVITNWQNSDLKGKLALSESISIITNLLDNSIFWLKYAKRKNRFISVYITDQIKGFSTIVVSDNGPGFNIPIDIAIKPFMTGKPQSIGSGLGLHVANEIMTAMKGKLMFITDENDITFPEIVRKNGVNKAIIAMCFPKE